MIRRVITPNNNMLQLSIPSEYIGREIEVLLFARDELGKTVTETNASRIKGLLSADEAVMFDEYITQSRNEWNMGA